jgi:hypothetical protein
MVYPDLLKCARNIKKPKLRTANNLVKTFSSTLIIGVFRSHVDKQHLAKTRMLFER